MIKHIIFTSFFYFIVALFFVLPTSVWAEQIDAYDVVVDVKQSGELFITETIDYDFGDDQKHGIYRDIPFTIKYKSRIRDIGVGSFHIEMDGISVKWEKLEEKSKSSGEMTRIKIGSQSFTITGKHQYLISYTVKKGVLPATKNEQDDAIRWNVIGTGWDVPIHNIHTTILLPAPVTKTNSTVSTFTGEYGSTETSATSQWFDEHRLQVYVQSLKAYEGLTVEVAYPVNLLDQKGLENVKFTLSDLLDYWLWPLLLGFLAYFRKQYKLHVNLDVDQNNHSSPIQYEPPKDMSLLRSGLLLDKRADDKDFSAAILELGSLGYLKVVKDENGETAEYIAHNKEQMEEGDLSEVPSWILKSAPTVLVRTDKSAKDLTDDQDYLLNQIIFPDGVKEFKLAERKRSVEVRKKLREDFETLNDKLYEWSVKKGYLMENPKETRRKFLIKSALLLSPVLGLSLYSLYQSYGFDGVATFLIAALFIGGGIVFISSKKLFDKFFSVVMIFAGLFALIFILGFNVVFTSVGVFFLLVGVVLYIYLKWGMLTPEGMAVQQHLFGLQKFIRRNKKYEIKQRLETDPLFLEKLLPYAVMFGETDHWLSFFDGLNVVPPVWYQSYLVSMNDFTLSVQGTFGSSSGGGGFSGGGGYSGGGGGGGGGGSW